MNVSDVTPLVLTYNEAPNIARTLSRLAWASSVVVVDSFSSDETVSIASRFPNVRIFQRKFDSHAAQWNFGLRETGISSPWVLALDADYVLPPDFPAEVERLLPGPGVSGYRARFRYCIGGAPLRATVYPPVTVLFRRETASYVQSGHTQRLEPGGSVMDLISVIDHDDRKPFSRWFSSQKKYMELEAEKLSALPFDSLDTADKLRRLRVIAPAAAFLYCFFGKGLFLDGMAGLSYSAQRATAEAVLSWSLLKRDLRRVVR